MTRTESPVLKLIQTAQDLDSQSRFILLALIHELAEHDQDQPIRLMQKDLHQITGVSKGKIIKIMESLMTKGYIFKLHDQWYLNSHKLHAMKQGKCTPERIPYRKQAA